MAILHRQDIIETMKPDGLIKPFNDDQAEPASYDLTIWNRVLCAGKGSVFLEDDQDFALESNAWAMVASNEVITMPETLCATYGIRSALTRRGLMHFGGPQIDPGYRGRLFVSLYNPTLEPIAIRAGKPFFTLIFHRLTAGADSSYDGSFQNQIDFPSEDVERMMRLKSKDLANVINTVETLDGSVQNLAENLKVLTSDVHYIKDALEGYEPLLQSLKRWGKLAISSILFIAGAVAVAAIDYLVENFLAG